MTKKICDKIVSIEEMFGVMRLPRLNCFVSDGGGKDKKALLNV
jgi:hypothetical protein